MKNESMERKQSSLTPVLIGTDTKPYVSVKKLRECLRNNDIRNVALTGPFGSGKSSVIKTLMSEEAENYHFLEISLATLDAIKHKGSKSDKRKGTGNGQEELSKRIEIGILQQLVYREKDTTLPYSRFRRIHFFENDELTQIVILTLLAVLSIAIAFEPSFMKIDTLYEMFNFGETNIIFDFAAFFYLLWFGWIFLHWLFKKYWGSKFSKLNLMDGEIEVKESGSIFNEHLEEIIYFFQSTDYDVVVLEDLDRFDNSLIFLKLRELNYLLRQSKVINRKIVFIYSVRDDLFSDASRTKFFDYIIPVVPIMNVSNAEELLKDELQKIGYTDIKDEDLGDIAGFIDDMRLLHNIVNEYQQYREQLMGKSSKLDATKLLASIVYKNYYPDEYALMHSDEGRIAKCIKAKKAFIEHAIEEKIEKGKENAKNDYEAKKASIHLSQKELRLLYVYEYLEEIADGTFNSFVINGTSYTPKEVAEDERVFDQLRANNTVTYFRSSTNRNYTSSIVFSELEKNVSEIPYEKRKAMIGDTDDNVESVLESYEVQEDMIHNYSLQKLLMQFDVQSTKEYKDIKLVPMEELFLKRGYVAEDYADYLSFFYPGMITENDRQLLLEMKLDKKPAYDRRIDKIDNFMSKLPGYVYDTDSIMNLQVVAYLVQDVTKIKELTLVVKRLKQDYKHQSLLVAFNKEMKLYSGKLNQMYMHRNADDAWKNIMRWKNEQEKELLMQIWLQWALVKDVKEPQRTWLNKNYGFLSSRIGEIDLEKATVLLAGSKCEKMDAQSPELLEKMVKASAYEINAENLAVICSHYLGEKKFIGAVYYSDIKRVKEEKFQEYVQTNINDVIRCLPDLPFEPADSQILIINDETINEDLWVNYISKQTTYIPDAHSINNAERLKVLYTRGHVDGTWANVYYYYAHYGVDKELASFVSEKVDSLEKNEMTLAYNEKLVLYHQLILTNLLPLDVFKKLYGKFGYKASQSEIDYLDMMDEERISYMTAHSKIEYSVKMRTWMEDKPEYADFMMRNKRHLIEDYKEINYTPELGEKILESNSLTDEQKRMFIPMFSAKLISGSSNLAYLICRMLNEKPMTLDVEQVLAIIKYCKDEEARVTYAAYTIDRNINDLELIKKILTALRGKIQKLAENGNPRLQKNYWNELLIKVLQDGGFISSVSDQGDSIKVYTKKW